MTLPRSEDGALQSRPEMARKRSPGFSFPLSTWNFPNLRAFFAFLFLKSSWWRRHPNGAAHRLETCDIKGGGRGGPPHRAFYDCVRRIVCDGLKKFR
jgi:hypothetical protein